MNSPLPVQRLKLTKRNVFNSKIAAFHMSHGHWCTLYRINRFHENRHSANIT